MESIWITGMMSFTYKVTRLTGHKQDADVFQERTVKAKKLILEAVSFHADT